ncbi:L,D-transpeptidase LdtMt5 [Amycolatopsis endophytica]|uniref:Lipoprotein-anchoring transpeptidase ErfK/SrfK n=1 Tax=Amycolatopsis endophytica TaxID=860233 RepID=A0A853B1D6_9PSEU|nr:Ig-like domain-containing protein [Amycolatopsis endophytica]NYI88868.1 lipoprotein-anchoring transpeptidase ErfK/SrfK [Amycolatopsis endophytica]
MIRLHNRRGALIGLGLAAVLTLGACSGNDSPGTTGIGQTTTANAQETAASPAKVSVQPGDGAKDVAPGDAAQVTVTDGELQTVTLTNPDGKQVAGELSADKRSWTVTEDLGYGKTYTWSGTALGQDGKQATVAGSFSTVSPRKQLSASLNVGDDQTYGIAMPIAVTFSSKVTDKAAAERALSVETTPETEGSWAWVSDTSAHWRPKEYWQPNTQVKVSANIYGLRIGDGTYGKRDVSAAFSIGRSQIVRGDTTTHHMQVIRDGVQIADYPVSYGLDSDPGRVTHSGVHVVMSKHATYSMSNPRYGYTDVNVPWAVRISNNGEFIHGLASSVWAQGKQNVSHGCLNLSPSRAKEYYDGVLTGDPVEITGSTQTLSAKDGDYSDWTYSWADWTKLSALAS